MMGSVGCGAAGSGQAWNRGLAARMLPPEAFLSNPAFALPMARFPEAERRRLHKMICVQA